MTGDPFAARLDRYERFGIKLGLDNVRALCEALGHPEGATPAIHVTGTNGKGSTSAYISAVLWEASYPTGLYTSPHLCEVTERIKINDVPVTPLQLERALDAVDEAAARVLEPDGGGPTYFEVLTVSAFLIFAQRMIDAAVYEVGLGGRLDATNVVNPEITCVTGIALDHTAHLGDTIAKVAGEKAGIIKPGKPLVCGLMPEDAREVVLDVAARVGAPTLIFGRDFGLRGEPEMQADGTQAAVWWGRDEADLEFALPLHGRWQADNAACALAVLHELCRRGRNIKPRAMLAGLRGARWRGRMEWLSREPGILFDGAHNPSAAAMVATGVVRECPEGVVPVLAVLKDKDADGICTALAPLGPQVVVTASSHQRALEPEVLAHVARAHFSEVSVAPSLAAALERAAHIAPLKPAFVVGSLMNYAEAAAAAAAPARTS